MSGTEIDRAVHDYLDGRLSEEERRTFEARLEREPELARTVEAYRVASALPPSAGSGLAEEIRRAAVAAGGAVVAMV